MVNQYTNMVDANTYTFMLTTVWQVLLLISLDIQDSQIGKVPVLLLVIESVPDHILVRNLEPHIVDDDIAGSSIGLAQQGTDFY